MMYMLRMLIRRLIFSIITLFLVSLVIFLMLEILPGDAAERILGRDASAESLQAFRAHLHLDLPAPIRYGRWIGSFLIGDLGTSLVNNRPITAILGWRITNTLLLSAYAFALYVPLTLIPALTQAMRRDRAIDHFLSVVTLILLSIPDFLLGTILIVVFVIAVPLLPAMSVVDKTFGPIGYLRAMTLPALTLAIVMAVYAVRMLRDNLIEVLDSEFVRMAELKGLSRRRVLWRHALPNALIPTLNVTALNLAYLIGGLVVIEKVFGYPGFGSLLIDALQLRDLPVIEATMMISASVYIAGNLIADSLAMLLNPRMRSGEG